MLEKIYTSLNIVQDIVVQSQERKKRMLSSICHVRSVLQEDMQLNSTSIDNLENSDVINITSVSESAYVDSNTEVADMAKSHLDSELPALGVGDTTPQYIFSDVLSGASIDATELKFLPLSFFVKGQLEFDCKVFDRLQMSDISAEFPSPSAPIGSLPPVLSINDYKWVDTGQLRDSFDMRQYNQIKLLGVVEVLIECSDNLTSFCYSYKLLGISIENLFLYPFARAAIFSVESYAIDQFMHVEANCKSMARATILSLLIELSSSERVEPGLPLLLPFNFGSYIVAYCVDSKIIKATVQRDEMVVQEIKSNIVLQITKIQEFCNEYTPLEADFVLVVERTWLEVQPFSYSSAAFIIFIKFFIHTFDPGILNIRITDDIDLAMHTHSSIPATYYLISILWREQLGGLVMGEVGTDAFVNFDKMVKSSDLVFLLPEMVMFDIHKSNGPLSDVVKKYKILHVLMPPIQTAFEESDPTINSDLNSKPHQVFNVFPLILSSTLSKELFGDYLVRCGCILWFEKQKEGSMLEVALDNEASEKFFWVVNTDKEEHNNIMVSVQLYSNLEDKVLIEGGRIVMNITKMEVLFAKMSNYIWDPGKMSIYSRGI
ncbi:hypothetical protein BC332_00035 [Capsicum chinense]|nr:hypothetical protein BC332_00035 [Capsicum chinense]